MTRYDWHIYTRSLQLFVLMGAILIGVNWINLSVQSLDGFALGNQKPFAVLEHLMVLIPIAAEDAVPFAAFIALTYLYYRMHADRELIAINNFGIGPTRVLAPYVIFGLFGAVLSALLIHSLVPFARLRVDELGAASLGTLSGEHVQERRFQFPVDGLAIYVGSIADDRTLKNVFIHDARNLEGERTFFAESADLLRDGSDAVFELHSGHVEEWDPANKAMRILDFESLQFRLSEAVRGEQGFRNRLRNLPTAELLVLVSESRPTESPEFRVYLGEVHERFAKMLRSLVYPLLGVSALLLADAYGVRQRYALVSCIAAIAALHALSNHLEVSVAKDSLPFTTIYYHLILALILISLNLALTVRAKAVAPKANRMTLSAYLVRKFVLAFIGVLSGMFVLQFLLGVEAHLSSYKKLELGMGEVMGLTLLMVPESLYDFLPPTIAFATLWMTVRMSVTSEMKIIRTFGISGFKTLAAPASAAMAIGVVSVGAINPVISSMSKLHSELVSQDADASTQIFIQEDGLIWFRQVVDDRQTVVRASRTQGGRFFEDVHVFMFDADGRSARRIHAASAELVFEMQDDELPYQLWPAMADRASSPGLCLKDVLVWNQPGAPSKFAEPSIAIFADCLPTRLTPDQIRESLQDPSSVSFWRLFSMVERLEEAGFSATQHRIRVQSELAKPFLLASMALLGGMLAMRSARLISLPTTIMLTVVAILAAVILVDFAEFLGRREDIPAAAAAWLPPLAVLLMSAGGLLHLEDG